MNVAIVGGGIVGLFSAYFLAREGANVTIYDENPGKYSIHAAGLIEPYRFDKLNSTGMIAKMLRYMRHGITEVRQVNRAWLIELLKSLNKEPPAEAWSLMRDMAKFSLEFYAKLSEERNDFDYKNDGLLEVYASEEELERGVKEEKASPFSPKFETVDVEGFAGGIFFPELSRISTEKFVDRLLKDLKEFNVKLIRNEAKVNLEKKNVNGKKFDKVVLTNGVWITRFLNLPVTAFKGYGIWVKGKTRLSNAIVTVNEGIAISPLSDHIKLTGGFSADFSSEWRGDYMFEKTKRLVEVEEVVSKSLGFRPCSPDGFPIIGKKDDVTVGTGACRLGWSYAPAMGEKISELVLGKVNTFGYISKYVDKLDVVHDRRSG
ncbi:MAG: FAD-dependent oxidoreductase [Metallosphaera sp.]